MSRTRMSWDWVEDYPVFVYTNFIDHFKFSVIVHVKKKNDQNSKTDRILIPEYIQTGVASKRQVVAIALEKARVALGVPANWKEKAMEGVNVNPEICPHCGAHADTWDEIKHYASCDPTATYEYDYEEIDDERMV